MKKRLHRSGNDRFIYSLIAFLLLSISSLLAQDEIEVSGTVTASTDASPIPNVNILIKNTNDGTLSDFDGNFSITAPTDAVLVFSSIGFKNKEVPVNGQNQIDIVLEEDIADLDEVIVTGYSSQIKKEITGSVATVTAEDIENVRGGSTVSTLLAGKIPGVSFRMADGRPGASATIQIRNMGDPLYVIDGIQQDAGQFNNLSPNDIKSISVIKDGSASVYGLRGSNGVVIVTTKRGQRNSKNQINVDTYYGVQNWSRFYEATSDSYLWNLNRVRADLNRFNGTTNLTPEELERYKIGTEEGYKSFNWKDFIIKDNAPQYNINVNSSGGSENINYYISGTHYKQEATLGSEWIFQRTNIQNNLDVNITKGLKIGVQTNGRIEIRENPGVPGGDDYWLPRFAMAYNRPFERPYANDNPEFPNTTRNYQTNWAIHNDELGGYWEETWRVIQNNFTGQYEFGGILEGLSIKGIYSYYLANLTRNEHEYPTDTYTYRSDTGIYERTGGSDNPWRRRVHRNQINQSLQGFIQYKRSFKDVHNVDALFVAERLQWRNTRHLFNSLPKTDVIPLIFFEDLSGLSDNDDEEARLGYVGKLNYNYANKYFAEISGRQDYSWKFAPGKRGAFFPSVSLGWRIGEERFMKDIIGEKDWLNELKLRASYGELGSDFERGVFEPYAFAYIPRYRYPDATVILDGEAVISSRDQGTPFDNISWLRSKITNIGIDFSVLNGKLSGTYEYFYRTKSGYLQDKNDVLLPLEANINLPRENLQSQAQSGLEFSVNYIDTFGDFNLSIGTNLLYSREKFLESYKPRFENSWHEYRFSREGRYNDLFWGYNAIGQFESQEQIDNYPIDVDNEGNRTLLPGDLIYEDINNDKVINGLDMRPIGYGLRRQPLFSFGINIRLGYKNFDFTADFSGGSGFSWLQEWETRIPYVNGGSLNKIFLNDSWKREDPFDINSAWTPGKYPALRYDDRGHSNYNRNSTFWLHNVAYLRARTIELGYTLPKSVLDKIKVKKLRVYLNSFNLFSIDNLKKFGVDPEVFDTNGLQYPQHAIVNAGIMLSI